MSSVYRVPAMRAPVDAEILLPGSKSHANRAIVCACLGQGKTVIRNATPCDDVLVMVENLQKMGFRIQWTDKDCGELEIHGGIPTDKRCATLDFHNAGTSLRFLASVCALVPGEWTLTGNEHMQRRPIKDLVEALKSLGALVEAKNGCPPLTIQGGTIKGSEVRLKADISSQYLTSLLLIAPVLENGLKIELIGDLASEGYVSLTEKVMKDFGIEIKKSLNKFIVQRGDYSTKNVINIEGDWSAAGSWLILESLSGSSIKFSNLFKESEQSDKKLPSIIEKLKKSADAVINVSDVPDQLMNIAVFAAFRKGKTTLTGAANLRHKECDRLAVITSELKKAGIQISEQPDGVTILGKKLKGNASVVLDPHDDHRMAMCFTILGLLRGNVTIKNPECVCKSYPRFFQDLEMLLRSTKPITIIGMRGVGKSGLGRRLASKLKLRSIDSDHLFVDQYGPIKEYIAKHDWTEFRKREEEVIAAAIKPGTVLALGGGALESAKTRALIKKDTIAVWLMATEKELVKRLSNGKRPSLTGLPLPEEVHTTLLKRGPQYREAAKIEVPPKTSFGEQVTLAIRRLTELTRPS